ncbi:hypothetical protein ARMSODRAFT_286635 [Armillaria solidipes]|uniref:Uncharacterized protein n=1 Tax=Armillaria solidipes TaxID=1076256 RepID=A0A2H3CGG9_9AGAR|nr:hypothetical protein ARMSODRAFT_286635 [Armillaria solidipes]
MLPNYQRCMSASVVTCWLNETQDQDPRQEAGGSSSLERRKRLPTTLERASRNLFETSQVKVTTSNTLTVHELLKWRRLMLSMPRRWTFLNGHSPYCRALIHLFCLFWIKNSFNQAN